jgi:hypothetical protein
VPYIKYDQRKHLTTIADLGAVEAHNQTGRLNFLISRICHQYIRNHAVAGYDEFNEVLGVLDSVSKEFYRSVVAPYEDTKRKENGPVSTLDGGK